MTFNFPSEDDVIKLISETEKKSFLLDPMPTPLMLEYLAMLLPVLTLMIKLSLELGQYPLVWKRPLVFRCKEV